MCSSLGGVAVQRRGDAVTGLIDITTTNFEETDSIPSHFIKHLKTSTTFCEKGLTSSVRLLYLKINQNFSAWTVLLTLTLKIHD